jgi:hypothetical protein
MLISTKLKSILEILTAQLLKIQGLECYVASGGVDRAPADPLPLRGTRTYRIPKSVADSFGLDSILLTEGRILRDLGETFLTL